MAPQDDTYTPESCYGCGFCPECVGEWRSVEGPQDDDWLSPSTEEEVENMAADTRRPTGSMVLIQVSDPEGTYCCHLTPRELHEATATYWARENNLPRIDGNVGVERRGAWTHYRTIDGEEVELQTPKFGRPAIYPSLVAEECDEDRRSIDSDDYWTQQAYRRYTALLRRAAETKKVLDSRRRRAVATIADPWLRRKINARLLDLRDTRLRALRWDWVDVEAETHRSWEDVSAHAEVVGRDGERLLNRERYEVRYAHRDPSDWQILDSFVPEEISDAVAEQETLAEEMDEDFTAEDRESLIYHLVCTDLRSRIDEAWSRYHKFYGVDEADMPHARLVHRWARIDGKFSPRVTITQKDYIERKIAAKGDELLGLRAALAGMRYRLKKQGAKKARIDAYRLRNAA